MARMKVREYKFGEISVHVVVIGNMLNPVVSMCDHFDFLTDGYARREFFELMLTLIERRQEGKVHALTQPEYTEIEASVLGEPFCPSCHWSSVMFDDTVSLDWVKENIESHLRPLPQDYKV